MDLAAASTLLGGIGLFLLGMSLMTESLSALGGDSLRRLMAAVTRNRVYGLLTGAAVTATVQSSSATTLLTVGFVSAGLLTFADALPVIFGANIGTTSTAWIVSLIGLKVKVSTVALPLVGVGALIKLLTRGRRARLGLGLSGFGLIFVGIDLMQAGMASVEMDFTAGAGIGGPLGVVVLVGVGLVMTVVMQSSSAAVATTLVALNAGSITLHQAAALVIGQNVGTTVTAILGAVGSNVAGRRAAAAHVLFNALTAAIALGLLPGFVALVHRLAIESPETAVALFHTGFNLVGVALIVPFTGRFAVLVARLVPERGDPAVRYLSKPAQQVPALALEAARRAIAELAVSTVALGALRLRDAAASDDAEPAWRRALQHITDPRALLRHDSDEGDDDEARHAASSTTVEDARDAASKITQYLAGIRTAASPASARDEHVELLHAVDHVRRMSENIAREPPAATVHDNPELQRHAEQAARDLDAVLTEAAGATPLPARAIADALQVARDRATQRSEAFRAIILARLADGDVTPAQAEQRLAASRWIGKTAKHGHRAFRHVAWTSGAPHVAEPDPD